MMDELKHMLEAIHKENKDIISLLCSDDGEYSINEVANEVDTLNLIHWIIGWTIYILNLVL